MYSQCCKSGFSGNNGRESWSLQKLKQNDLNKLAITNENMEMLGVSTQLEHFIN